LSSVRPRRSEQRDRTISQQKNTSLFSSLFNPFLGIRRREGIIVDHQPAATATNPWLISQQGKPIDSELRNPS